MFYPGVAISQCTMRNQDEISWNRGLGRNMNDWEVDALAVLIDIYIIKSIAI